MKYTHLRIAIIGILATSLFFSCQKEMSLENGNSGNTGAPGTGIAVPAATPVNGSIAGRVVDENEMPLANAEVTIGNTTYYTNSNGLFNSSDLALDKYLTTVKVSKQGYFTGYRNFCANPTKNYLSFKLLSKTLSGSFASTNSAVIVLSNGTEISFLANSIITKTTGAAFTGTVNVYAKYIDPTSGDISAKVPGCFLGIDAGRLFALQSKGMIAVELESLAGEALQLKAANPAGIKMPIPLALRNTAPATIATWSLNDKGIWIREDSATRNGNNYEMKVSHFSFWNVDVPIDPVYLTINVKTSTGNILSNTLVQLQTDLSSGSGAAYGFTDSLGNVSGLVPKNEVLAATIFSSPFNCSGPLYTQNIGPFATNASVNIIATLTAPQLLTVSGNAVDCAGSPVTNGTAVIYAGGNQLYYSDIVNGAFNVFIPHCNSINTLRVVAVDYNSLMQSDTAFIPVTGTSVNTGNINTCVSTIDQYIHYTIDGTNYVLFPQLYDSVFAAKFLTPGVDLTHLVRQCYGMNCSYPFQMGLPGNAVGTFIFNGNCGLQIRQFYSFNMPPTATATFTSYGNVGGEIEGSFYVPFIDNTDSLNHLLTGTFKLRRAQ